MAEPEPRRRLAAVLATDAVGYSRLMGQDEAGTHGRLKALRKSLVEPQVAVHHGHIVKLTGDGALIEFASVVDAVLCAVDVQRAVAAHDQGVPDDQRIALRIGINLGDVIFDDGDIYGDGVNVAARLETLAEPGGICVSRTVYNHVKDKVDLTFEPMGEHRVKNIAEPITIYRVPLDADPASLLAQKAKRFARTGWRHWPVATAAALLLILAGGAAWYGEMPRLIGVPSDAGGPAEAAALPLPDKPSIAVLPFDNLSGDPEQDYFVDGVTEDLITALSRFDDLFVIARHSTFVYKGQSVDIRQVGRELGVRYVLEGSLQRAGDRVRVTAQLIDASTGHHLWAERYERQLVDIFAVQDEVTQRIAATLGAIGGGRGVLQRTELARTSGKSINSLRAFDYYLRAIELHDRFTKEDMDRARELFRKAIELDPAYGRARSKLAFTYYVDYVAGWASIPEETLAKALETAEEAVAAAPSESWTHWALAAASFLASRHEQSLRAYAQAVALNPNDADIHAEFGLTLSYVGRAEEGVAQIQTAMRLNPYHPDWYLWNLGIARYNARQYEDAVAALAAFHNHTPQSRLFLAASHAQLGEKADAEAQVAEARLLAPDYTVARAIETEPYQDRADLEHYVDGLRKAGLPENLSSDAPT
ncbi:MAG TPA: adenylate/guanylate cyclase domain-containing protein [Geminicoccaceae bacterium]